MKYDSPFTYVKAPIKRDAKFIRARQERDGGREKSAGKKQIRGRSNFKGGAAEASRATDVYDKLRLRWGNKTLRFRFII